jgi:hypothetical protein
MHSLIATALSTIWLTAVAAILTNLIITRLETITMANSSAALVAAFTPVAALIGTQAQEIVDLKAKLAAIVPEDPQTAADLAADEAAIADTIAKAAALAPASPAPVAADPSPAPLAPAANSIADQLAAAAAEAGTSH